MYSFLETFDVSYRRFYFFFSLIFSLLYLTKGGEINLIESSNSHPFESNDLPTINSCREVGDTCTIHVDCCENRCKNHKCRRRIDGPYSLFRSSTEEDNHAIPINKRFRVSDQKLIQKDDRHSFFQKRAQRDHNTKLDESIHNELSNPLTSTLDLPKRFEIDEQAATRINRSLDDILKYNMFVPLVDKKIKPLYSNPYMKSLAIGSGSNNTRHFYNEEYNIKKASIGNVTEIKNILENKYRIHQEFAPKTNIALLNPNTLHPVSDASILSALNIPTTFKETSSDLETVKNEIIMENDIYSNAKKINALTLKQLLLPLMLTDISSNSQHLFSISDIIAAFKTSPLKTTSMLNKGNALSFSNSINNQLFHTPRDVALDSSNRLFVE